MTTLENLIKHLEERLLQEDIRSNPQILDELLGKEFVEVGVAGSITSREDVIDWLVNKDKNTKWSLDNFQLRVLAPNLVLCLYQATKKDTKQKTTNGSMRSSIWQLFGDQWKIVFHQGTRIERDDDH